VSSLGDYHFKRVFPIWFQVRLSLEHECWYPILLECIRDNLIATTCFRCSLLEVYALES
jgi:hypothetical protein